MLPTLYVATILYQLFELFENTYLRSSLVFCQHQAQTLRLNVNNSIIFVLTLPSHFFHDTHFQRPTVASSSFGIFVFFFEIVYIQVHIHKTVCRVWKYSYLLLLSARVAIHTFSLSPAVPSNVILINFVTDYYSCYLDVYLLATCNHIERQTSSLSMFRNLKKNKEISVHKNSTLFKP